MNYTGRSDHNTPRKSLRSATARRGAQIDGPHPQTILFAVTGMSPAVITETVWALAQETPPVIPDQVVVVTTISGRQAIERELGSSLAPEQLTIWQQLRRAVLGPNAESDPRLLMPQIRVIEAPNPRTGRTDWLEDLRTPSQNSATSDFLLAELRRWTETPNTRLIASMAGGRKTMGALLYSCLSLIGRQTDRITHVLVSDPFDDPRLKPRFYFPKQSHQELAAPGGEAVLAAKATIELADLPFVPLRNLFERNLVQKPASFTELVRKCRVGIERLSQQQIRLTIARSRLRVTVNEASIETSAREHRYLLFLAERAKAQTPALPSYAAAFAEFNTFCEQLCAQCVHNDGNDWRDEKPARFDADSMERFCIRTKNTLKEKFERAGPDALALLRLLPKAKRFALDLAPSQVKIIP